MPHNPSIGKTMQQNEMVNSKKDIFLLFLRKAASPCGIRCPDGLFCTKLLEQRWPKLGNNATCRCRCSIRQQTDMRCSAAATLVAGRSLCQCICPSNTESVLLSQAADRRQCKPHSASLHTGCLQLDTLDTQSSQQWSGNDASTSLRTNDWFLISPSLCGNLYSISAPSRPPKCFLL